MTVVGVANGYHIQSVMAAQAAIHDTSHYGIAGASGATSALDP
jgi:hypothetical protein